MDENELSNRVIGAAIEVHKQLGPGLLESVYESAMAIELAQQGLPFERQKPVEVCYKGRPLEVGFRIDLLVGGKLIVELKSVSLIMKIHEAQVINYLKLSGCRLGLLLNFNVVRMQMGIKRVALGLNESTAPFVRRSYGD